MPEISATEETSGIQLLADTALHLDEAFFGYQTDPLNYSFDEDIYSPSPIHDTFNNSSGQHPSFIWRNLT